MCRWDAVMINRRNAIVAGAVTALALMAGCTGGAQPAGFSGDYIYQLIYEAQDPKVQGLGFAATRDIISFLRHDASSGNPPIVASDSFV